MKILILVYSVLQRDVRVLKQLEWLKGHDITVIGFEDYSNNNVCYIPINNKFTLFHKFIGAFLLTFKLYMIYYWLLPVNKDAYFKIKQQNESFELIISNDIYTLPLALRIKKNAKLIYDAHEFYPLEHNSNKLWMFFFHGYMNFLHKVYAPKADLMFTIGNFIAHEYKKRYNLNPIVLMNLPVKNNLKQSPIKSNSIRLVHHGAAFPGRNLELMIDIVKKLDSSFNLDFYLVVTNKKYIQKLLDLIQDCPRINIHPPLNVKELITELNLYDAGFYFLQSKSFNDIYCLPNKLFDFIQARLAVIIGPSPEMKKVVEDYQCGYVTSDFNVDNIVKELSLLSKGKIDQFKQNSNIAAEVLNADSSKNIFLNSVNSLFKNEV